jgi:hypothetical protein
MHGNKGNNNVHKYDAKIVERSVVEEKEEEEINSDFKHQLYGNSQAMEIIPLKKSHPLFTNYPFP